MLDLSISLKEQESPYMQSWSEVIREQTESMIKLYIALYLQAMEHDYALTELDKEAVEEEMVRLDMMARMEGVSARALLRSYYGPNITLSGFREIHGMMRLVTRFVREHQESFEFTEEEFEAAYLETPERFDMVTFRYFSFPGNMPPSEEDEPTEEDRAAFRKAQEEKANEFLEKVTTSEAFHALVLEYTDPDDMQHHEGCDPSDGHTHLPEDEDSLITVPVQELTNMPGEEHEFLADNSRKPLEKAMFEDSNGNFGVFLFVSRARDERQSVDVRHILLRPDPETDDPEADAKQRAEALLQEWRDGEATEESFAALASEKTDDAASIPDGGLYRNINEATNFVEPFLTWCLDEARQPGDTGIVETDHGFHIMFFVRGQPTWRTAAWTVLAMARFDQYCDEIIDALTVEIHEDSLARFAMGDLIPLPEEDEPDDPLEGMMPQ